MGWDKLPVEIENTADHFVAGNYAPNDATWFQQSWWDKWSWGWIYTNDTSVPVKLKKATFHACAGHSGGKSYKASSGASLIAGGYGCTFTSDVYIVDKLGKKVTSAKNIGTCDIPSIVNYNCYYYDPANPNVNPYGNTDTNDRYTSFGNRAYFGPTTAYYKDDRGNSRCREPKTITYTNSPSVPPGGKMFVVVRPTKWKASEDNYNQALLVLQANSADTFTAELEPENNDYIWICKKKEGDTEPKWYKEQVVHMRTSTGWKKM